MDKTTFAEVEVIKELANNWVLLKLDLTEATDENDALIEKYGFAGLPSFRPLPADGTIMGSELLSGKKEKKELLESLINYRQSLR